MMVNKKACNERSVIYSWQIAAKWWKAVYPLNLTTIWTIFVDVFIHLYRTYTY